MQAMAAAALAPLPAGAVAADGTIHEILRRRVEVAKRAVGMAACVVTPGGRRFVACGHQSLGDANGWSETRP